jgi:hypothetical protein
MRSGSAIVVGGCHRSGTSLIRRILDAHHRIHCGPEVKFFRDFYGDYFDDPLRHLRFTRSARALLPEDDLLEVLGSAFVALHERAAARAGKPRWADKNPENVLYLEQWQRLLGDRWLFVHVVRNPLDTLASMEEAGFPLTLPRGLQGRIDLLTRYTESGISFGNAHPERYYRVLYEDVGSDPRETVEKLMAWLGETFDEAQLTVGGVTEAAAADGTLLPGLEDPKIAATSGVQAPRETRWRDVLSDEDAALIVAETAALWSLVDPGGRYPLTVGEGALRPD